MPEESYSRRPYERPYGMSAEPAERRTLDPQTALDRLLRRWALVAVGWLAVATIVGLQGASLGAGLLFCLVGFIVTALRHY